MKREALLFSWSRVFVLHLGLSILRCSVSFKAPDLFGSQSLGQSGSLVRWVGWRGTDGGVLRGNRQLCEIQDPVTGGPSSRLSSGRESSMTCKWDHPRE